MCCSLQADLWKNKAGVEGPAVDFTWLDSYIKILSAVFLNILPHGECKVCCCCVHHRSYRILTPQNLSVKSALAKDERIFCLRRLFHTHGRGKMCRSGRYGLATAVVIMQMQIRWRLCLALDETLESENQLRMKQWLYFDGLLWKKEKVQITIRSKRCTVFWS